MMTLRLNSRRGRLLLGLLCWMAFSTGVDAQVADEPGTPDDQIFRQLMDREYVIGIGDSLDLQVWKSQEFSRTVTVRSDGKVTMPVLGDVQAAGLEVSAFQAKMEQLLAKYLREPRVTITVRSSRNIQINLEGVVTTEFEAPRGTKLGAVLRDVIPNVQKQRSDADFTNMRLIAAGTEFPINGLAIVSGQSRLATIRLEWGDTIVIPSPEAEALPEPRQTTPQFRPTSRQAQFTASEYAELIEAYPGVQELLQPFVTTDGDQVSVDLEQLSRDQLDAEIWAILEEHIVTGPAGGSHFSEAQLLAITVDLKLPGLVEAYLAVPDPTASTGVRVQSFQEGDVVTRGDSERADVVLDKILDAANQVVLTKGDEFQVLNVPSAFTELTLTGTLNIGGKQQALVGNLPQTNTIKPLQTRFEEGDEIVENVSLVQIEKEWMLLQRNNALQLVLLRDPRKHVVARQTAQLPPESVSPEPGHGTSQVPPMDAALKRQLPEPLQALDTFSKVFFATPLL